MNLQRRAWWDAAVAATVVICCALVWIDVVASQVSPTSAVGAVIALVLFAAAYAGFGRWMLGRDRPALARLYFVIVIVLVGLAVAADGTTATVQIVAFPLIGILAPGGVVEMIAWYVAVAVSVFSGFALGRGGVAEGATVAGLSLLFAVAMGLWILRIIRWGAERTALLTEVRQAQQRAADAARDAGAARERERLSRDMHDTVAQSLTGMVMLVERAERQASGQSGDSDSLRETLATLEDASREALREIRALVAETSAETIDRGLVEAAQRVVARFERETGVSATISADDVQLDREREVVLLRCLQEGLGNVRKHAKADRVETSLRRTADGVVLTVTDDGVGIGSLAGEPVDSVGFGLSGMRERVRSVGGEVRLTAAEGRGASLRVSVPASSDGHSRGQLARGGRA
ncbi:MAG TPA: sensor histidine kinase [Humibacter sp.]|nr:sensor histidine kinase [Humibacter sp.]